MIIHKINHLKQAFIAICILLFTLQISARNNIDDYFKFKSEGKNKSARTILNKWTPKSFEESSYKKYFLAVNDNKTEEFWSLYQELAKNKKLLKLQHDSVKRIIEIDLDSKKDNTKKLKDFNKTAKKMLENMRAQPEGLEYELLYLKWILKNKNTKELCKTERSRWLSQTTLNLSEVVLGLDTCPITTKDFIYRVRMLTFSGEEKKAQLEINEFVETRKMSPWEKAYLQAVYFSNIGDPTSAFKKVIPFQKEISKSEDYYINLFYISQRAGELAKAEEVINEVMDTSVNAKQKKELQFQKAFLFYQTKRYDEALKILNNLVQTHPSAKRRVKSREYDDLTWLRAWCYYLSKNFEKAREALMQNRDWARDKARNLYWLAQAEWALDNQAVAIAYYRQLALPVIDGKYFSYYNYLSWLRFESYKSFATSDLLKTQLSAIKSGGRGGMYVLPDPAMNPLKLLQEYAGYFEDIGATDEGSVQIINQEEQLHDANEIKGIKVRSTSELKNEMSWADDLIKWGYRDLAKWHLFEIEKTLTTKNEAEPLINYYTENKYYNRALALTQNIISPNGRRLNRKSEPLLWNSLYPKAYESAVESESKKRKVEPYLVWSIMKAETQYKHDAISPVGAVGLMQFMPYTSQKVAIILDEEHKVENMFSPDIAVKYGATYLRKLSEELGGQMPLVAAAYNGGPHRVKLWLRNFKEKDGSNMDYDVFVEHIPFNETRTYVKRVMSFMLTYQKLYDDKLDAKSTRWLVEKIPFKLKEPIILKEEWPFDKK
ncbi:MAG: transglycosylase SLT domain-containing protein [Pseudobdellovibrio sp.]